MAADDDAGDSWEASMLERHGYLSWLGVTVESISDGRAVLRIPARDELRNIEEMVGDGALEPMHGGVVATLVDTSSAVALRSTFERPMDAWLTTTNLDVSYLRPVTGDLRAEAEVVRAGRSMGVTDVHLTTDTDEGDEKVAVGRTNYRLFREEEE